MLILTLFNRLFIYFRKLDHENLIEAVTVVYPSIIKSPNENTTFTYLNNKQQSLPVVFANDDQNLNEFPHLATVLHANGSRLNKMKDDLVKIDKLNNKAERLNYLQNVLNKSPKNEFLLGLAHD